MLNYEIMLQCVWGLCNAQRWDLPAFLLVDYSVSTGQKTVKFHHCAVCELVKVPDVIVILV